MHVVLLLVVTEEPQSVTALLGTVAQFHCADSGFDLFWLVDGLPLTDAMLMSRGMVQHHVKVASVIQSNLTVLATTGNNGTIFRCGITPSATDVPLLSENATLRVLSGMLTSE